PHCDEFRIDSPLPARSYTLSPYTPLFRSGRGVGHDPARAPPTTRRRDLDEVLGDLVDPVDRPEATPRAVRRRGARPAGEGRRQQDRKSTRLNSSHVKISYAVFCLKKKNKT